MSKLAFQAALAAAAALLIMFAGPAQAASLSDVQLTIPSPAHLWYGQRGGVSFDYEVDHPAGVRIHAVALHDGGWHPNAWSSGSALVPVGTGSLVKSFGVNSGNLPVDQVLLWMEAGDTGEHLLELIIDCYYEPGPQGIWSIDFDQPLRSRLALDQDLNITFAGGTDNPGGALVFARPMSGGALTPGYGASGGVLIPQGGAGGTGGQSFSVNAAPAVVDQVRFQMWTPDQSALLLEFFVPVEYHWGTHGLSNFALSPPTPASLQSGDQVVVSFDYATADPAGVRIYAYPYTGGGFTPDGGFQGSAVMPAPSGAGSRFVTVGSPATVDGIHLRVTDVAIAVDYLNFDLPVRFQFGEHKVTDISISPLAPEILSLGEHVTVDFTITNGSQSNVRCFAWPSHQGMLLNGYSYGGSPPYPPGATAASTWFTVASGPAEVDEIVFFVKDESEVTLLEYHVPARIIFGGSGRLTGIEEPVLPGAPLPLALLQNRPNPFNPTTVIPFELPREGHARLSVFDLRGRLVARLVDGILAAGRHEVPWQAPDLASGTYFYRLEADGGAVNRKLTIVR